MKWLGSMLIVLSCALYGVFEAVRLRLRERRAHEAAALTGLLENELARGAGDARELPFGGDGAPRWVRRFRKELSSEKGIAEAFEACAGEFGAFPEREILEALFLSFGTLPLGSQLEELARARDRLARAAQQAAAEKAANSRLRLVLWCSAGAALALLLL